MDNSIDVFISHSSDDVELVKMLIDLIRKAFNIPSKKIRCTSIAGYRLPLGSNTSSTLRNEVNESKVFIGVITPNSIKSVFTMFEFGARWGSRLAFLPIICDKSGFDLLSGPLTDINAANANEKDSIQEFLENLGRLLDIPMEPLSSLAERTLSMLSQVCWLYMQIA